VPKPSFERVKQLAQELSPEERTTLFEELAALPDSPIKLLPRPQPAPAPAPTVDGKKALKDIQLRYEVRKEQGQIIYLFEGREVFRLSFNAENYADVFFEKLKTKDAYLRVSNEQRERVYQGVRDVLAEEGMTVSNRRLRSIESQALHELGLKLLKDSLLATARRMGDSLPQVAAMIFPRVTQATLFAGANQLRETLHLPEQKFTEAEIRNAVQRPEWEYLKRIMGIPATSRGGAHNVKHLWNDSDRECLARKYAELQPVWLDAKEIAKESLKSRVRNRKTEWREEVLRRYPNLPSDLLEAFSTLRGGAKPSDNAVIHASRECNITPGISARRLREVVTAWNLKYATRTAAPKRQARKLK
jgi:ribose 1,5-bisphosphokinase PhnN